MLNKLGYASATLAFIGIKSLNIISSGGRNLKYVINNKAVTFDEEN